MAASIPQIHSDVEVYAKGESEARAEHAGKLIMDFDFVARFCVSIGVPDVVRGGAGVPLSRIGVCHA
jgi:hypothetical protein